VGQHSDPSFEEFFAATYARLVGLLFALLHDQAQAEDAVQDAFASALLRWRSLRGYRSTAACQPGWTQVDLASGHRRPAFGGLTRCRGVQPQRRRPLAGVRPYDPT
jgi:hypothetical protein